MNCCTPFPALCLQKKGGHRRKKTIAELLYGISRVQHTHGSVNKSKELKKLKELTESKETQEAKEDILSEQKKMLRSQSLIRVQIDLDELELGDGVSLKLPDLSNLANFQVNIKVNVGLWKGNVYTFDFKIPVVYPYRPPKVLCKNEIYHPNIDLQGNVCLNTLEKDWRSFFGIQQVINQLILLFYVCFCSIYQYVVHTPKNKIKPKNEKQNTKNKKRKKKSGLTVILKYRNQIQKMH